MQIIEQSIAFSKKLAYTFFQSKREAQIFGLTISMVWLILLFGSTYFELYWRKDLAETWGDYKALPSQDLFFGNRYEFVYWINSKGIKDTCICYGTVVKESSIDGNSVLIDKKNNVVILTACLPHYRYPIFILLFALTNYALWRFVKKIWRNEKQVFKGLQKGMVLTTSAYAYTIEPDMKVSEWNFQLAFGDYDLEFDAKWIFKIENFAYITQPIRLIKRVEREERKIYFIQKGIGEIATSLYKIDDDTLYDSFGIDSFTQADKKSVKPIVDEQIMIAESAQKHLNKVAKTPVQILYNPQNPQINYVLIDINGEATTPEMFLENKHNMLILFILGLAVAAYLLPFYFIFYSFWD